MARLRKVRDEIHDYLRTFAEGPEKPFQNPEMFDEHSLKLQAA